MKCNDLKSVYIDRTGDWVRSGNDTGKFYLKEEVDAVIAELKQKLEDVQASHYAESVDAGMENRRLKRALYKACANWAHFAVAFFSSYATKDRWYKMEQKCQAKAEKYK